jgi:hypothetical protein
MLRPPHDPRDTDKRNIAAQQKRKLRAAKKACGEAKAYAQWSLTDSLGLEPKRVVYCARHEGRGGWLPSSEEAFGDIAKAALDAGIHWPLRRGYWPRYSVGWTSISDYNPVPESVLAERRAKRKAKKEADERRKAKRKERARPLLNISSRRILPPSKPYPKLQRAA